MSKNRATKIGDKNNFLTILKIDEQLSKKYKVLYYICLCECGNTKSIRGSHFRDGSVKSCGCKTKILNGMARIKHGLERHRLYPIWSTMRNRCYNVNNKKYKNYGLRGIKICQRWHDVSNFIEDMYPLFVEGLSLDRIDVNGDYTPENCRWATPKQQANNKQNTIYITFENKKYSIRELSDLLNLKYSKIYKLYLKNKDTVEQDIKYYLGQADCSLQALSNE